METMIMQCRNCGYQQPGKLSYECPWCGSFAIVRVEAPTAGPSRRRDADVPRHLKTSALALRLSRPPSTGRPAER